MEELENKKNKRKKTIILIVSLLVLSIIIIFYQQQSINTESERFQKSLSDLEAEMTLVKKRNEDLLVNNKSLNHKKDSLQNNLSFLWKYKTLVKTARLRDQVGEDLPYKSGERVRMKTDSSIVVITDLIVGGNTFNYYIKYLVKTPKGLTLDVSPFEIESIK